MKDPYTIIVRPHITEKSVQQSYGDPKIRDEKRIVRKYTFIVQPAANKIEIKQAIEAIYNAGKKEGERIQVSGVCTLHVRGKMRRVGARSKGKRPDFKKAVVTLKPGQLLEDYGV